LQVSFASYFRLVPKLVAVVTTLRHSTSAVFIWQLDPEKPTPRIKQRVASYIQPKL